MTSSRWLPGDRRVVTGFLAGLVVLVMLVGDPRAGRGSHGADGADDGPDAVEPPARLCRSLDEMAVLRDALVDGTGTTSMADLRSAATRTREVAGRTAGLDPPALAGLLFFTELFLALPDEPTSRQLMSAGRPASVTDQAHADALVAWLDDHCRGPEERPR